MLFKKQSDCIKCGGIVKPELTAAQLELCKSCCLISGKKVWCGWFGFFLDGRPDKNILTPSKKIITPNSSMPILSDQQMKSDYAQVSYALKQTNRPCLSEDEYIKRRAICKQCSGGFRCPHCGCGLQAKLATPDWQCPSKKF